MKTFVIYFDGSCEITAETEQDAFSKFWKLAHENRLESFEVDEIADWEEVKPISLV